ncbi:tyrosine-type recombinase/integrase [Streptomyces sp. NPDC006283]|uniref:tyrosine-type recombinase/integrase n=1 Tax=Streptomyces sp. NPDC006283 TaxID=3156741 RepID=UPI0033BA8DB6
MLTVWHWTPGTIEEWISEVRPGTRHSTSRALWPSERPADRAPAPGIRFAAYRDAAGLDPALEFHSLRRSYITHLIEDGHDPLFVQQQVGHDHASTTAIYTCVSSYFRTRSLRRVLDATIETTTNRPDLLPSVMARGHQPRIRDTPTCGPTSPGAVKLTRASRSASSRRAVVSWAGLALLRL